MQVADAFRCTGETHDWSGCLHIVKQLDRMAEIVEAIATGCEPPELTAESLAERIDLPLLWPAQEQAVGIC
jgi:hypothetical protein